MQNHETPFHSKHSDSCDISPNVKEFHQKIHAFGSSNNVVERQPKGQCDTKNNFSNVKKTCNAKVEEHRDVGLSRQFGGHKSQIECFKKDELQISRKSIDTKSYKLDFSDSRNNAKISGNLCSCACVMEAEENETILKDLQDQIQELNNELNHWKSENQLLKTDIFRAKNIVKREMGGKVKSFEDLMKKTDEDGWIGQQEMILSLKKELHGLKEVFKEKGLRTPSPVRKRRSILPDEIPDDRKIHWRLKIERDDVIRHAEREKQDLIEVRDKLKEKVESMSNRNEELSQEINSIREELSQKPKTPNGSILFRIREIEKKMKFYLKDKHELRRSLEEEEIRENSLLHKIAELKDETVSQKKILDTTEDTLENQKKDEEKHLCSTFMSDLNSSFGLSDVKEMLYEVEEEYQKKMELCGSLTKLIFKFEEFYSDPGLRSSLPKHADNDKSSSTSISTDTFDEVVHSQHEYTDTDIEKFISEKPNKQEPKLDENASDHSQSIIRNYSYSIRTDEIQNTVDEDQELVIEEFISLNSTDECQKLSSSFEAIQKEISEKSENVYNLFDSIKDQTEQLLNSYSQLWKIVLQIKMMMYKYKNLKKLSKHFVKKSDNKENGFCHDASVELFTEGEMVLNILRKENKFLKMLITSVYGSKTYDFDLFRSFSRKSKELFYAKVKT
ncbi:uncharacterized protein NPIL_130051 [Nephila pilipes]|uniref:Uncharacterized protein n=1 Tax=Nephila pilipes TaxID=299642 RepID=A0A8X6TJP3_NEPPI|nr:uncharacterized protein NPIL_130051 [Nephila pilipes]